MTKETRVTLTDEMYEALAAVAAEDGQTKSVIHREALARYLMLRGRSFGKEIHPEWGGDRHNPGKGEG